MSPLTHEMLIEAKNAGKERCVLCLIHFYHKSSGFRGNKMKTANSPYLFRVLQLVMRWVEHVASIEEGIGGET